MLREVPHIFDHFDFSTFPDKEDSKAEMGTRFTSDDLVLFYKDYFISLSQISRIINSPKSNKVTFNDMKKGW